MAIGTGIWFNNSLVGIPSVASDVDIHRTDVAASAKFAIGTGFERSDGARFRYCHFGASCNRGIVVATDASESCLADS